MKDLLKIAAIIFLTGFGLNLVWEVMQTLWFFDFPGGNPKLFILIHLQATSADAGLTLLIYALVMALTRKLKWLYHLTLFRIIITMFTGFIIAVIIEINALETGRWSYGHLMPIIPYLKVGLMPVVQMTILPLAAFIISRRLLAGPKGHSELCPYGRDVG